MRLGVIADVHCDARLLEIAAKELVDVGVDEILLAGDAHYEYRFSNEVTELIRSHGMRYIAGNHETTLLGPGGRRAREAPHVRKGNLDFVHHSFEDVTMAVLNKQGCAMLEQKVHGAFDHPEVDKPNVLIALAGPAMHLLNKAKHLVGAGHCEVFYTGSLPPPQ